MQLYKICKGESTNTPLSSNWKINSHTTKVHLQSKARVDSYSVTCKNFKMLRKQLNVQVDNEILLRDKKQCWSQKCEINEVPVEDPKLKNVISVRFKEIQY